MCAGHCSQRYSFCFSSQRTSAFTRAMTTSSRPQDHPCPHPCSYEAKQKVKTACLPNTSRGTPFGFATHCVALLFRNSQIIVKGEERLYPSSHICRRITLLTPREPSSSPFISFVWCKAFAGERGMAELSGQVKACL